MDCDEYANECEISTKGLMRIIERLRKTDLSQRKEIQRQRDKILDLEQQLRIAKSKS